MALLEEHDCIAKFIPNDNDFQDLLKYQNELSIKDAGLIRQEGKEYLVKDIGLTTSLVSRLPEFGFSSIANILASIKLAKFMNLGKDEAIITVATDGADLYLSELE